jgi:hypothetical protein
MYYQLISEEVLMEHSLLDTFSEKNPARYTIESNLLLEMGLIFMENVPGMFSEANGTHKEYAVCSTLHRGYYYPSPVYDLIIGNAKRGRLVRNPTTNNVSHCYHYDGQHRLLRVDSYYQGSISHREYLRQIDQTIFGFTVDCNGDLSAVCREIYNHGRIASLSLMHCVRTQGQYYCFEYIEEHYLYDETGLSASNFVVYRPGSSYIIYEIYEFQRESGRLVSYTNRAHPDRCYRIAKSKQRKA